MYSVCQRTYSEGLSAAFNPKHFAVGKCSRQNPGCNHFVLGFHYSELLVNNSFSIKPLRTAFSIHTWFVSKTTFFYYHIINVVTLYGCVYGPQSKHLFLEVFEGFWTLSFKEPLLSHKITL